MPKITIEIKSCRECPFFKLGRPESTDGWDRGHDWMCKASNDEVIQSFVEWHEEDKVPVPDWCPARDEKII